MKAQRSQSVDIAKGIAIICIILGHMNSFAIRRVVFTFHVPIFYLITGWYISAKRSKKAFLLNKAKTLLVPYALACCVIVAGASAMQVLRTGGEGTGRVALEWLYAALYGSGNNYKDPFYIKAIGAIWFLWASFWGACALRLLLDAKAWVRPVAVLGIFLLCCWSRKLCWLPLSIQAGGPALLYMYIGWLVRQSWDPLRTVSNEAKGAFILGALVVWTRFMADFQSFSLVRCDTGRGAVDIFGSLCGCCIVLLLARCVQAHLRPLARILAYFGRYSLLMLCAHIVELDVFPWGVLEDGVLALGAPYAVSQIALILCKFAWIIPVTALCERWSVTRRLFGYGPRPAPIPAKSVTVE